MSPVFGYVSLGSNLGDRLVFLQAGLDGMAARGIAVTAVSSAWDTAPVGTDEGGRFLNAVAKIETDFSAERVLAILLDVERSAGRFRTARNAARTLDLDLLLLGDQKRDGPGLTLPHPRMWERAFVLLPLAEVAPDIVRGADGLAGAEGCVRSARLALPRSGPVYSRLP